MITDEQRRWYMSFYGMYSAAWSLSTWSQPLLALLVVALLPLAFVWPVLLRLLVPVARPPRTPALHAHLVATLAHLLTVPMVLRALGWLGNGILGVAVILIGAALWHTHPLLAPLALALLPARAATTARLSNEGRTM